MGDSGGDVCAAICGGCCLALFSGLASWCNLQTYGARGCCCGRNRVAGCCGSCCNDSFDEDKFDEQVKKDLERTRDPNAPPANTEQPQPSKGMLPTQDSQLTVEKGREE